MQTPNGPVFHRFTFDGYGETATGADWDIFPTKANQTFGRLWPLLTGERGEYELLAGGNAKPNLRTIARTANDGLMLPEQVWDGRAPTGEPAGEGTRSATPLAWTHGSSSGSCGRSRTASRWSGRASWRALHGRLLAARDLRAGGLAARAGCRGRGLRGKLVDSDRESWLGLRRQLV